MEGKAEITAEITGKADPKEKSINDDSDTSTPNDLLVTWEGPDDPENPLNWSKFWKWSVTLLTSFGGLVTLMSGAMLAPALEDISKDINTTVETGNMILSIYVLAFGFGPLLLAPLSEVYGRRIIWIIFSASYVLWNTLCGIATNQSLMLAGRILSGVGASAEFAISIPVLSDCWRAEERGHSFAIATFVPLLGPALGPILGGVITNSIGWRWLFWVLSIFDATLVIASFWLLPETYEQILLHRKAMKLSKITGRPYRTQWDIHSLPLTQRLKRSLVRPVMMLATQPILQVLSLFMAYSFGTLYLVLSSFAFLWTDRYHQSVSVSGLHYIAIVLGGTIGSQLGGPLTDFLWNYLKTRSGGHTAPEYRVPLMIPGLILVPAGLFMYGWFAEHRVHWAAVDVGVMIFNFGTIMCTQAQQQYNMEAFKDHVASANAACQLLRSIFAFCFPIFGPALFKRLGYGWGNSIVAFIFMAITAPAPFVLWKYGARLRAKGKKVL